MQPTPLNANRRKWQVELGNSNSSVYNFETFDLLDEDDLQVRTYVPPAVDGLPSTGTQICVLLGYLKRRYSSERIGRPG